LIDIFLFMALSIEKQIVYRIAFLGRFNGWRPCFIAVCGGVCKSKGGVWILL
jgi:hypothetical protein